MTDTPITKEEIEGILVRSATYTGAPIPDELRAADDYYVSLTAIDFERLKAAALRGLEDPWEPIESAPKDGTSILVTGGTHFNDGDTIVTYYMFRGVAIVWWSRDGWCAGSGGSYDNENWHKPTHWMPLPAPPSKREGAGSSPDEGAKSTPREEPEPVGASELARTSFELDRLGTPKGLEVGIVERQDSPGSWGVEAIDTEGDDVIHNVIFSGPFARENAVQYAIWKFGVDPSPTKDEDVGCGDKHNSKPTSSMEIALAVVDSVKQGKSVAYLDLYTVVSYLGAELNCEQMSNGNLLEEVEQLKAERDKLRAALRRIDIEFTGAMIGAPNLNNKLCRNMVNIARTTLAETKAQL